MKYLVLIVLGLCGTAQADTWTGNEVYVQFPYGGYLSYPVLDYTPGNLGAGYLVLRTLDFVYDANCNCNVPLTPHEVDSIIARALISRFMNDEANRPTVTNMPGGFTDYNLPGDADNSSPWPVRIKGPWTLDIRVEHADGSETIKTFTITDKDTTTIVENNVSVRVWADTVGVLMALHNVNGIVAPNPPVDVPNLTFDFSGGVLTPGQMSDLLTDPSGPFLFYDFLAPYDWCYDVVHCALLGE